MTEEKTARERWQEWEERTGYHRPVAPPRSAKELEAWASRKGSLPVGTQTALPHGQAETPGHRKMRDAIARLKDIRTVLDRGATSYQEVGGARPAVRALVQHNDEVLRVTDGRMAVNNEQNRGSGNFTELKFTDKAKFEKIPHDTWNRLNTLMTDNQGNDVTDTITRRLTQGQLGQSFSINDISLDKYRDTSNVYDRDVISDAMKSTHTLLSDALSRNTVMPPDGSIIVGQRAGERGSAVPVFVETREGTYTPLNGSARTVMAVANIMGMKRSPPAVILKESQIEVESNNLRAERDAAHATRIQRQTEEAVQRQTEARQRQASEAARSSSEKLIEPEHQKVEDVDEHLRRRARDPDYDTVKIGRVTADNFATGDSSWERERATSDARHMNELFDNKAPSLEGLTHMFSGDKEGQQFERTSFSTRSDGMDIRGRIVDSDGFEYGTVERNFSVGDDGRPEVYHAYFEIRGHKQAGGVGDAVMRKSFESYQRMGLSNATVTAGLTVGRYNWARVGFDWKSSHERTKHENAFLSWVPRNLQHADGRRVTPEEASKIFSRFQHSWHLADWRLPKDLAWRSDVTPPREPKKKEGEEPPIMHPGKAFMLSGGSPQWSGKIVFDPAHPTFKRAMAKVHMRDFLTPGAATRTAEEASKPLAPERRRREGQPRATPRRKGEERLEK